MKNLTLTLVAGTLAIASAAVSAQDMGTPDNGSLSSPPQMMQPQAPTQNDMNSNTMDGSMGSTQSAAPSAWSQPQYYQKAQTSSNSHAEMSYGSSRAPKLRGPLGDFSTNN